MKRPPYFKAWFAFFLLATLGGFIAGALIGLIFGVALAAAELGRDVITSVSTIAGFIVGMPISFFCFRWSIQRFIEPALRDLGHQEITLSPPSVPPVGPYEPPRQG
jgi:hypothetical protein